MFVLVAVVNPLLLFICDVIRNIDMQCYVGRDGALDEVITLNRARETGRDRQIQRKRYREKQREEQRQTETQTHGDHVMCGDGRGNKDGAAEADVGRRRRAFLERMSVSVSASSRKPIYTRHSKHGNT